MDKTLNRLRVRRFSNGVHYRMCLYVDAFYAFTSSEVTLCVSFAGSKSRRQANNFVDNFKYSTLGQKTNKVPQSRGQFVEMFKELLMNLEESKSINNYTRVFLNLSGADERRTKVYYQVLLKAGFEVYINDYDHLTLVLKNL